MDQYFVIHCNDDGEVTVDPMNQQELLKRLLPKDGETYYGTGETLDECPPDGNPQEWPRALLIIKGTVVQPRPKTVVTELEID